MDYTFISIKECREKPIHVPYVPEDVVELEVMETEVPVVPPESTSCTIDNEAGRSSSNNNGSKLPERSSLLCFDSKALQARRQFLLHIRKKRRIRGLNSQLLEAIKTKDFLRVEKLLDQGANPNATCYLDHVSACHLAVFAGTDILKILLSHGAEKMRADRLGRTPLHLAAWEGKLEQIALLLDIPEEILEKITANKILEAIAYVSMRICHYKELVNIRCELNEATRSLQRDWLDNIDHDCTGHEIELRLLLPGWTPLHAASANAQPLTVLLLLTAGSDPSIRDDAGRSALDVAGYACYSGLPVDKKRFAEVVKHLLRADPTVTMSHAETQDTTIHTAVEVESIDAINQLLTAGASVLSLNKNGLTPMHICVERKLEEHLEVLVYSGFRNSECGSAVVDAIDKYGRTLLHFSVLEKWPTGVCVALEAGANVTAKTNDGDTAIDLAAALGNLYILNEIINVAKTENHIVNYYKENYKTALYKAVVNGHADCVARLLEDVADIDIIFPKEGNLYHISAERGLFNVLQALLANDKLVTEGMINFRTEDDNRGFAPIHCAVLNNHIQCVELLLSKNACVSLGASLGPYKEFTTLHLAAMKNNMEMVKILIHHDETLVHRVNHLNRTPLHTAIQHKNRDIVKFFVNRGADLSACTGGSVLLRTSAIDMIMNNLSKPTEFIEEMFDSYIQSNNLSLKDPDCTFTVCYDVILPKNKSKLQLAVIEEIIESGNRQDQMRLLVHPLVESFLYLKWNALMPFFFTTVTVYGAFVLSLTIFSVSAFYFEDSGRHAPTILKPEGWGILVFLIAVIWLLQELIVLSSTRSYYWLQIETYIKLVSVILALGFLSQVFGVTSDLDSVRHVASLAVLLSWVVLMFLMSRFHRWGYYVLMFKTVSWNVLKILLAFAFLILGFSFSFMIEFHSEPQFEDPFAAFVKTMVMMLSEFDYDNLIDNEKKTYLSSSLVIIRLIFLSFLIFTSIVLMNLMVGVAVNDLRKLELTGNIRRLEKQVELLAALETLANKTFIRKFLPAKILDKFTVKNEMTLFANGNFAKIPPKIMNSIFEIIDTRKQHTDKEIDSQAFKTKLDIVHSTVIRNKKILRKIIKKMKNVNLAPKSTYEK